MVAHIYYYNQITIANIIMNRSKRLKREVSEAKSAMLFSKRKIC